MRDYHAYSITLIITKDCNSDDLKIYDFGMREIRIEIGLSKKLKLVFVS